MNILAISDRPCIGGIREIVEKGRVDLVCTLGDLELSEIRELELITNVPKLGVYGNHDSGNYMEGLGIKNMHLKTFTYKGVIFGGFEGCVRYKYTQEEALDLMRDFSRVDVFLSHCSPFGINDDPEDLSHTGFVALRNYLKNAKPKYLLHGHTYPTENELVKKYQDTNIIYVYGGSIVRLEM